MPSPRLRLNSASDIPTKAGRSKFIRRMNWVIAGRRSSSCDACVVKTLG